jgi:nucleoside-diphosphate-sugar epimerase
MTKITVTGANGFVGSILCAEAASRGFKVMGITRASSDLPRNVKNIAVGSIDGNNDWKAALLGCEVVVHLAARAHILNDDFTNPLDEFRRVNVQGTINLAKQAAAVGVRRFIFVSSIGVNGAETFLYPFSPEFSVSPNSPYAISKYEAEIGLKLVADSSGMEFVIIRPPLVYGPRAPGNFGSLVRWLKRGVPLPFGAINNKRSLVSVGNLVDLILTCITHDAAANQIFMVSDDEDISTTELLRRMGQAIGHPALLVPVPAAWLKLCAKLIGKTDMAQRLCGSLQVDISKTRQLLGWTPPLNLEEGFSQAAIGFKND